MCGNDLPPPIYFPPGLYSFMTILFITDSSVTKQGFAFDVVIGESQFLNDSMPGTVVYTFLKHVIDAKHFVMKNNISLDYYIAKTRKCENLVKQHIIFF